MNAIANEMISDIQNLTYTIGFEMKKSFKRNRIFIGGALALAFPILFYILPLIVRGDFADTPDEFINTTMAFMPTFIIIVAAIFCGDTISSEFAKKTGLLLFPTPQRRTTIFVGKYICALLLTWGALAIYYLVAVGEIMIIYEPSAVPVELITSFLIAMLYTSSIVSVIYFFSGLLKGTITSTLCGLFLLMMFMPIIETILSASDIEPWFMLTYYSDLITSMFAGTGPTFGPGHAPEGVNMTVFEPDYCIGVLMMGLHTIGFFGAGLVLALRRRME